MGIDKEKINNKVSDITSTVKSKTSNIINNIEKTMVNAKDKTKDMVNSSKDKVVTTMDVNGDGNVDIEDIIILGLKLPGIGINRSDFLKKELSLKYSDEKIEEAINKTPKEAGISLKILILSPRMLLRLKEIVSREYLLL